MYERAEIFLIDDEGIVIRSYTDEAMFFYIGDAEEQESPLMHALAEFYVKHAEPTLMCWGYHTPSGDVLWESEMITPSTDAHEVDIAERLYLVTQGGERVYDEYAYRSLSAGEIPPGWTLIPREASNEQKKSQS